MKVGAKKINKLNLVIMIVNNNGMLFTAYDNAYPGVLYLLESDQQRPVSLHLEGKFLSQVGSGMVRAESDVSIALGPRRDLPAPQCRCMRLHHLHPVQDVYRYAASRHSIGQTV